jgi:hypothetical protein
MNWNRSQFRTSNIVFGSRLRNNYVLVTFNMGKYDKLSAITKENGCCSAEWKSSYTCSQLLSYVGCIERYVSRMLSRAFFFVVMLATISFTWAIMVPKREAAHRKRKIQKTCKQVNFYQRHSRYSSEQFSIYILQSILMLYHKAELVINL